MESLSLLERIAGRAAAAVARPKPPAARPPSPESDYSPPLPPCAQELVWTDSNKKAPPEQPSPKSRRAKQPEPECSLARDLFSFVQEKERPRIVITDSSDEEFEKFLTQLKTPKASSGKASDKHNDSLKDFIVDSDDDYFASTLSQSCKTSKAKSGKKTCDAEPERPQRSGASLWWDSPVFTSDSDDSVVIKSTWRDRHRKNDLKIDNRQKAKSEGANGKENTSKANKLVGQEAQEWPAWHWPKSSTSGSSDEEFDSLMDRIKARTKNQTPCATASKIRPKTAATEPAKAPCFDLTNTKARNSKSQMDPLSSPYFYKNKDLKAPAHSVERTPVEKTRRLCKVEGCFLQDLSCSTSIYVKSFKQKKQELTTRLYSLYNQTIFDQKLPENLEITWNKKMSKTAGYCVTGQKRETLERYARIELSEKVCDSADRLRDTLIHELCHASTWLINGVRDGHGQYWKLYARKATLHHPELPMVSRCHSYAINYKFTYECSRCRNTIGRHSKSLDTEKFVCALCKGKLILQSATRKDGSPAVGQLTPFAKFVKENYGSAKKEMAGMNHAEVMRKLSADFSTKTKLST